jgi:uncharacterized protein (TIGR02466 family)
MDITGIFSVPFGETKLQVNNDDLVSFAYKVKQHSPGTSRDGGYQSPWIDLQEPIWKPLVDAVQNHATSIGEKMYMLKPELQLKIVNGWVNINEPKGSNLHNNYYHMHGGYFTSFVYYAKVDNDCGNLVLTPPHSMLDYVLNEHTMTAQNLYNHQRWHVIPEQGKLVMFPAWITHFAESNQSNEDRISFAFNAVIETKEQENKNGGK